MYTDNNDTRTPRDRVSEEDFAKYLLGSEPRSARERRSARQESCPCGSKIQPRQEACPLSQRGCGSGGHKGLDCRKYTLPLDFPLAIVYAPVQTWRDLYDEKKALSSGTLFMELDKPFEPKGRKCR